jgi:hypothetical protein
LVARSSSTLHFARADPAIFAIVVDAKEETTSTRFYEHLGFRRFMSRPGSLFVPIATVLNAFDGIR